MKKIVKISIIVALFLLVALATIYFVFQNQYSASEVVYGSEICDNGLDDNQDGIVDGCWDPDRDNYQPSGRIYYVSAPRGNDSGSGTSDSPYKTINKATSQVGPGEAVYVMPGVYNDYVEFANRGTPEQPILLKGIGEKGSIIIRKPAEETSTGFRGIKPRSNTIIDNFMTDGVETVVPDDHSQGGYGIQLLNVENILIKNCILQQHDTAIRAEVGSRLIVRDTLMRNNESGTYVGTDNDSGAALEFKDTLWENVEAADRVPYNENLDGFLIEGNTSHHVLRNCKSHGWSDAGFDIKGHVIIENSIAYNNRGNEAGYGFKIWRDGLVRNSIAYDNSYANYLFGGYLPDWKLINSISYNGKVSFEKRTPSSPSLSADTITLSHNIFVNTQINDEIGDAFEHADHNLFFGGDIPNPTGVLSKTERPLFENENNRDFHLVQHSAPIDAGSATITTNMLTVDLDGRARKSGSAVDIGPYEYSGSTPPDNTNHPPIIDPIPEVSTSGEAKFTVIANDPDGDPVTLSVSNLPDRAVFNPDTGAFSWVSSFSQRSVEGTAYNIQFTATDSKGATSSITAKITVRLFYSLDKKIRVATTTRRCAAPCTIDFMAETSVGGRIKSYIWGFGDRSTGKGKTVSHTYRNPGTYTVTIDITTGIRTRYRSSFKIEVLQP